MASERGKGKGKGAQRSSSRNAGQAAEIFAADVVPTSAAVLMLASVPPPPAPPAEHDAGALEASLTLASLSMPGLAAGALGPGEVAQLPGSPGTRADNPTAAESTAEQDKEEQRRNRQAARKRRQRENVRAASQVTSPTTASAALAASTPLSAGVIETSQHASPRSSPRKSPIKVPPAAAATGNWSAFCDVRMVLAAVSSVMEPLLKLLGHPADRQELQGSSSANKCDPTHAFFEQLAVIFNDVSFLPVVPDGWDTYNHLKKKVYAARYARDASFLQTKWNACRARVEVATRRYSEHVETISDSESDSELVNKKQKKPKATRHDHSGITFRDDGDTGKMTKAKREGAFIAALDKMAPERHTPLEILLKRKADLVFEEQSLLVSLTLAHGLKKLADPTDEVEFSIAQKKIAKLNAQMVLTETNQELNNAAILKAEQEHTDVERSRACRKDLLAQLEHDTGNGKHVDDGNGTDGDDETSSHHSDFSM